MNSALYLKSFEALSFNRGQGESFLTHVSICFSGHGQAELEESLRDTQGPGPVPAQVREGAA